MTDALLKRTELQEALSRVYAHAVAVRAGYVTAEYEQDLDGVDLRIQAGGASRPALDLQLKATVNLVASDDEHFKFPLKVRNYELLRIGSQTPRLLVVLDLPRDERQWITIATDELVMRRRAYWLNLKGADETINRSSVTVWIPKKNVFNVKGLQTLMDQSRQGRIQ